MITEGYLARHSLGKSGMKGPALLDVVQDYVLYHLHENNIFEQGVVLKGGTSLRKFRAGNSGRFSTDLDFSVPDPATAEAVLDTINGAEIHDVVVRVADRDATRGRLEIDTPLGPPAVGARIEITDRPLWLPCESVAPIDLPVHGGYEFSLPQYPVPAFEEAVAEKLAAWRRRRKMRDLYDLHWLGGHAFDDALVRLLTVLKVWYDVVHDRLGDSAFNPGEVIGEFDPHQLPAEEIGLLTQPVEPERWARTLVRRFQFFREMTPAEVQVARCDPRDHELVQELLPGLPGRR